MKITTISLCNFTNMI